MSGAEPLWLERRWVDALHFQQLQRFGGGFGLRDGGAVDSALARARNRWEYGGERDPAALAAAYAFGLARNHGYVDGNKRIAFVAAAVFLELNGWELDALQPEVVRTFVALAAGELGEEELAAWLRRHLREAAEGG